MSSGSCALCAAYRPHAQPRVPERPPVCDGDRLLLDRYLAELPELHRRLVQAAPSESKEPTRQRPGTDRRPADPLSFLGGAGPVPARSQQPRVSGSRSRPAPAPLDRIDLTLPARPAARRWRARGVLGLDQDQVGHLSVATVLDAWVRDWRKRPWIDAHLPRATVGELVEWLRRWLDHACDRHHRIGEFGVEVRDLRRTLRNLLPETDESDRQLEYLGASCRRCDLRGVLVRDPDDPYIQCGGCGALYTEAELAG